MSATNGGSHDRVTASTADGEASIAASEGGEDAAKPPLEDSFNDLRLDDIRPPHVRQESSTSIPLPARDDRSLHHRPTSGIGAEVHGSSDTDDSTAPNSPKAADAETKAAIRAAKDDVPIGEWSDQHQPSAACVPPTSGHAITAAKLFSHRYFANDTPGSSVAGSTTSVAGGASAMATPGGTAPPTPAEMSRQNSSTLFATPPNQYGGGSPASPAIVGTPPLGSPAIGGDSPSHHAQQPQPPKTSASPRRPTVTKADSIAVAKGHAHANEPRPALIDRKSVFGKFFDKKDKEGKVADSGAESDGYTSSGGGTGRLGRRPSGKKANGPSAGHVPPFPPLPNGDAAPSEDGAPMTRQTSTGSKHGGRTPSERGEEKSSKLRDMVAMAPKLVRKPSSSKGGRSDDGKSDDGVETRSRAGSQATASLLKKYGVCEKTAIGKGATAVVRLAHKWDRGTDKLYAVKEFRKRRKGETEKEYVKKLTSEFCISSTLHHENVVETVDLVQDENHHWCEVMEYCPGGDLYAAIKRGSMSQAEINSYFKQVLLGVNYLHSMGVAHRDIKPENLLLDGKGKVKITDFGVSDVFRMCWEKTTHMSKGLCGSEPYLPKEMFERKEYDARLVDVWASAVVYYCCCMQELPWRVAKPTDPSFAVYLQTYSSPSPTPLSNLHREARAMLKRMLSPEPEHRPQLEEILADKWIKSLEVIEVAVALMTLKDRV